MTMTLSGSGTIAGLVAGGLPDATVTQPDLAAGVAGNGPAFSAYSNADQPISNATNTQVNFGAKLFDTNTCFSTANSRFTPNVAGYYQLTFTGQADYIGSARVWTYIYKNGTSYMLTEMPNNCAASTYPSYTINGLVYLNGTTDYVEIYVRQDSGGTKGIYWNTTPYSTVFSGVLVRAA